MGPGSTSTSLSSPGIEECCSRASSLSRRAASARTVPVSRTTVAGTFTPNCAASELAKLGSM
eukprot:4818788-Prymnesium_polylepis.1